MRPSVFTTDPSWDASAPFRDRDVSVSFTMDAPSRLDGSAWLRVFLQFEPPSQIDIADEIVARRGDYDLILAWNKRVLAACPNARFFHPACCTWLGDRNWFSGDNRATTPANNAYTPFGPGAKSFAVSFLTSDCGWLPGHRLRQQIYPALPPAVGCEDGLTSKFLRVVKHMSTRGVAASRVKNKNDILDPYQFSIAVENESIDNWCPDKITDLLVAKTVPLYWGCPNIGDFYDEGGIIRFESVPDLLDKMAALTPDTYAAMLPAVEENHRRAMALADIWGRLEAAIDEGVAEKRARA